MKYTRYYADESGGSRTEDIEVELLPGLRSARPALTPFPNRAGHRVRLRPLSSRLGRRLASNPTAADLLLLAGELEGETSDGERRRYGPGSAALVEDTTGTGHRSWVVGHTDVLAAVVQLPD